MTAEKDNGVSVDPDSIGVEQGLKRANPFEKVGIWAGYRLLQYIQSLGQTPEVTNLAVRERHHLVTSGRSRWSVENIAMGVIFAGGVFLVGSMAINNIKRIQTMPYSIGVGPEQTRPEQSVLLDKPGSIATFRYGAIINNVEGLSLQVFPQKMEEVLREVNLVPPPGSILVTEITNSSKAGEDAGLIALAHARYEKEQGIAYVSTIAPLNFQELARSLPEGKVDPVKPSSNIEMGIKWLKQVKAFLKLLRGEATDFDPNLVLTSREILTVGRGLPFWIVSTP